MIHYHGCKLSGKEEEQLAYSGRAVCISFANQAHHKVIIYVCRQFMLDNGAFTIWKKTGSDAAFDFEGYAQWVEGLYRHPSFTFYIIPDSIGGDENDNARMRASWKKVCPYGMFLKGYAVWHLHESLDVLEELIQSFAGISIGSSGEYSAIGTVKWWNRMAEAMDILCDAQGRPKTKIHGLRMLDVVESFPFSSADSTNAARHAGSDARWTGAYSPISVKARGIVLMDNIETKNSPPIWDRDHQIRNTMSLF